MRSACLLSIGLTMEKSPATNHTDSAQMVEELIRQGVIQVRLIPVKQRQDRVVIVREKCPQKHQRKHHLEKHSVPGPRMKYSRGMLVSLYDFIHF